MKNNEYSFEDQQGLPDKIGCSLSSPRSRSTIQRSRRLPKLSLLVLLTLMTTQALAISKSDFTSQGHENDTNFLKTLDLAFKVEPLHEQFQTLNSLVSRYLPHQDVAATPSDEKWFDAREYTTIVLDRIIEYSEMPDYET